MGRRWCASYGRMRLHPVRWISLERACCCWCASSTGRMTAASRRSTATSSPPWTPLSSTSTHCCAWCECTGESRTVTTGRWTWCWARTRVSPAARRAQRWTWTKTGGAFHSPLRARRPSLRCWLPQSPAMHGASAERRSLAIPRLALLLELHGDLVHVPEQQRVPWPGWGAARAWAPPGPPSRAGRRAARVTGRPHGPAAGASRSIRCPVGPCARGSCPPGRRGAGAARSPGCESVHRQSVSWFTVHRPAL